MGIGGRIKSYSRFLNTEFSGPRPTLENRVGAILAGHSSSSRAMLLPEARESGMYLRESRYRRRVTFYNRHLYHTLHSKISQKLWLDRCCPGQAPPMTHYLATQGFMPITGNAKFIERDALFDYLVLHGPLILKPHDQGQGHGVVRVELGADREKVLINKIGFDAMQWKRWVKDLPLGMTTSTLIAQSPWSAKYEPETLSTLRLMTFTSFATRKIVLMGAAMKCARAQSFPTDNFQCGQGSVSAGVMLESGRLLAGVMGSKDGRDRIELVRHPETNAMIRDQIVPDWADVKELVLGLSSQFPAGGLVGWDIALSESGPVVLEANIVPGLDVLQSSVSLMDTPEKRSALREMRLP